MQTARFARRKASSHDARPSCAFCTPGMIVLAQRLLNETLPIRRRKSDVAFLGSLPLHRLPEQSSSDPKGRDKINARIGREAAE